MYSTHTIQIFASSDFIIWQLIAAFGLTEFI